MFNETQNLKGGVPRTVEESQSKNRNCSHGETPCISCIEKSDKPEFNPSLVILGLHISLPEEEQYCKRARCVVAREKGEDTKLVLVKKWIVPSPRSKNEVTNATFECPRCHHKTIKRNIGGSKQ